jgi:N-acetyl-D-muramate 6-phosphate phosphatase
MRRGLLFDLDGTLLDTAPDFEQCLNQLLIEEKKPTLSLATIREHVSSGARGLIQLAFNTDIDDNNYESLKQRLLDGYMNVLGQKTSYFDGIESLLSQLEEEQIPWGIVTNKPERFTFPLLKRITLPSKPQCIICADTLEFAKPHPLPIQHACKLLNIAPQSSMYVGDDLRDVQASTGAGMPSCVAQYGYIHQNDDPQQWQANYYVAHANEILDLFKSYS